MDPSTSLTRPQPRVLREVPAAISGNYDGDVSFAHIWRVLRTHKPLVLGMFLGTVAIALLVSLVLPKRYDACARIALNGENTDALGIEQMELPIGIDINTKLETQIHVIESDTLAKSVMRQLRLDQDARFAASKIRTPAGRSFDSIDVKSRAALLREFQKDLKVHVIPKTQIIEIRFRARDPKLAAQVVNALSSEYIEQNFKSRYEATMQAADWLSKQLDDLKTGAEVSQQKLADYQKKTGIIGTDETHNIIMAKLDELNRELSVAQGDRIIKEAKYRMSQTANPELIATVAPESTLVFLRRQQAELRTQHAQLSAKFGGAYPKVIETRSQMAEVDQAIGREVRNVGERIRGEYEAAVRSEQMLTAALDAQKQEAFRMNDDAIQFAMLQRDVQSSRDLYEGLMKRLKEAGILAGLRSTNVNIVDPADVPVEPAEPHLWLNLALASCGGLLGGVALALVAENADSSIRTPDDIELRCQLPALGVIPRFAALQRRSCTAAAGEPVQPMALASPQSQFSEAFRALRTSILLSAVEAAPKVIVVTSALPKEGKSVVATNCAIVLAQTGQRVLLVDADLRCPALHAQLQVRMNGGLSACLTGSQTTDQAAVAVEEVPSLKVLTSGTASRFSSELLATESMRKLIEQWKQEYDYIVIDTPPVLAVTDPVVLSAQADSILLVARSEKTGLQSLRRARDLLRRVNANLSGVVLNDFSFRSPVYQQYYGHHSAETHSYYQEGGHA